MINEMRNFSNEATNTIEGMPPAALTTFAITTAVAVFENPAAASLSPKTYSCRLARNAK